jgi:thioesterase domain-containing protein
MIISLIWEETLWCAMQLFREIATFCQRDLSPLFIYQAPTIRSLAAILADPDLPRLSPIIKLKAGTEEPPIFLLHGLGGNILEFFELAKNVQSSRAIYGIQTRGTDGVDEPYDSVEEMARFNLSAVRKLQPHGPYSLIGYSLGGRVTLEMAQQLSKSGLRIPLLAMLDSYPYSRYVCLQQRTGIYIRLTRYHLSSLMRLSFREALSYIRHRPTPPPHLSDNKKGEPTARPLVGVSVTSAMQKVQGLGKLALKRNQPLHYDGAVKFVKVEKSLRFPDNPEKVWSKLIDRLEVTTVPGYHNEMLTKYPEQLASLLSRYLREVGDSESKRGTSR